jgi:hypothetical protein
MNRRTRPLLAVAGLAAVAATMGACSQTDAIRRDLTPELGSYALTRDEMRNRDAINLNIGSRLIVDDFASFWHADKPSQLSPDPTMY